MEIGDDAGRPVAALGAGDARGSRQQPYDGRRSADHDPGTAAGEQRRIADELDCIERALGVQQQGPAAQ